MEDGSGSTPKKVIAGTLIGIGSGVISTWIFAVATPMRSDQPPWWIAVVSLAAVFCGYLLSMAKADTFFRNKMKVKRRPARQISVVTASSSDSSSTGLRRWLGSPRSSSALLTSSAFVFGILGGFFVSLATRVPAVLNATRYNGVVTLANTTAKVINQSQAQQTGVFKIRETYTFRWGSSHGPLLNGGFARVDFPAPYCEPQGSFLYKVSSSGNVSVTYETGLTGSQPSCTPHPYAPGGAY